MQPKQMGVVHFDSEPRGAEIIVDGQILVDPETEEAVRTPSSVSIFEGRHDFILRLHGSQDAIGYVDVYARSRVDIFRNFLPGTPGGGEQPEQQIWLDPNTGTIRIYSDPDGADVYIDGNPVRDSSGQLVRTPVIITCVPTGVRYVTFRMPGMMEEKDIVDVGPGSYSNAYATMRPTIPEWQ